MALLAHLEKMFSAPGVEGLINFGFDIAPNYFRAYNNLGFAQYLLDKKAGGIKSIEKFISII